MSSAQTLPATLLVAAEQRRTCDKLQDWLPVWQASQASHAALGTFTATVLSSLPADRLAWAFFSGYQGALQAAFGIAAGSVGAFAANETQRKLTGIDTVIHQRGRDIVLTGNKSWILTGFDELTLFVLARRADGPTSGPGSLSVVRTSLTNSGVVPELRRTQVVVPELPHSAVRFDSTPLAPGDVLPGDGYSDYAKPFRLREDVFVTGAVLGYLFAEAREGSWPTRWCQRAMAALSLLEVCSRGDPRTSETVILVAGALSFAGDVIREAESLWTSDQSRARDRWLRDKAILEIGKEARRQRAVRSWESQRGSAAMTDSSSRSSASAFSDCSARNEPCLGLASQDQTGKHLPRTIDPTAKLRRCSAPIPLIDPPPQR